MKDWRATVRPRRLKGPGPRIESLEDFTAKFGLRQSEVSLEVRRIGFDCWQEVGWCWFWVCGSFMCLTEIVTPSPATTHGGEPCAAKEAEGGGARWGEEEELHTIVLP